MYIHQIKVQLVVRPKVLSVRDGARDRKQCIMRTCVPIFVVLSYNKRLICTLVVCSIVSARASWGCCYTLFEFDFVFGLESLSSNFINFIRERVLQDYSSRFFSNLIHGPWSVGVGSGYEHVVLRRMKT